MVQPAYAILCDPLGHEVVVIANLPLVPPPVMVTVAVDVDEPEAFVAVNV